MSSSPEVVSRNQSSTFSISLSDEAKDRLKITGLIGLILLGGMVSAASAGAIFSYKATPLLLGGLVGVSAIGLPIGIAIRVDSRQKVQEARRAAEAAEKETRLEAGAFHGYLSILAREDELATVGAFRRTSDTEGEGVIQATERSLCSGMVVGKEVDILTLAMAFKRIYKELELLKGEAMGAAIPALAVAVDDPAQREATIERLNTLFAENLTQDQREYLANYIQICVKLAEKQETLPQGTRMSLDSVASMAALNLRDMGMDLEGTRNFTKIVKFMIENYTELFPIPARS